MTSLQHIPTHAINADALPRDRSTLGARALAELQGSIAAHGLRLPVEVFATGSGFGLLSGYRRLMAFRALEEIHGERFATIPAFVRPPEDVASAFARVVEENDIREGLSPWEQGRTLLTAREAGLETFDAALIALYPFANRQKHSRLRMLAEVVEAMEGRIAEPETWSENRLLRLGTLLRHGWDGLIDAALDAAPPGAEWQAILPVITEAESLPMSARKTPGRPRRLVNLPRGLTLRREKTRNGYVLHITGSQASDAVVAEVIDEIERMFG
jgi:ParB family chromosome partitioning protein